MPDRTRQSILDIAIDPPEREALFRWLNGESGTTPLAQALGISALSESQQRREVKRFKDRILKRIARLVKVRGDARSGTGSKSHG